jgi:hypothetical protein
MTDRRCSLAIESPVDQLPNNPLNAYLIYGQEKRRSNSLPNLLEQQPDQTSHIKHRQVSICDLDSFDIELANYKNLAKNCHGARSNQEVNEVPFRKLYSFEGGDRGRNHHRRGSIAVRFDNPKVIS